MTRSILFSTLAVLILTSCTLVADLPGQVAANVADAPTQTSPADTSSSIPVPTPVPVNPSAQKTYQSAALGVQFRYPDSWHLQEFTEGQPASVIVTSFDLSNPPHKLEWTDQTVSMQLRLHPAGSVPQTLDAWVEAARQTAESAQLSIFEEERFLFADQPAARLTLVSGSGGIIHQILTIQNGSYYEISIEGNLDLGKSILSTLKAFSPSGLKPSEGDIPAAGICLESQDERVAIVLGQDQSGIPQAGRCVGLYPTQRIKLINRSKAPSPYSLRITILIWPWAMKFCWTNQSASI